MNSEEIEFMENLIIRELKGFKNRILSEYQVQETYWVKKMIETKFNDHLEEMGYEEMTK